MKKRFAIAVVLALVMIFILTTPVLAGKPARGYLLSHFPAGEVGQGKFTAQQTHNDELKVTIVLKGAKPDIDYKALLWYASVPDPYGVNDVDLGIIHTDDNGNLRVRIFDPGWVGPANLYVKLELRIYPYLQDDLAYISSEAPILNLK